MSIIPALRALAVAIILAAPALPARANDSIGFLVAGDGAQPQHVQSIRGRRFAHVVQQKYDFSCGAAAITTIFREAYGAPVDEADVLRGMLHVADPNVVRERGFSLLDIKNYVDEIGLTAIGYRVDVNALRKLLVPGIVLLDVRGYQHFVVLRRVIGAEAYVADPALGNRAIPLDAFVREWNGIVLVVVGKGYRANNPLLAVAPVATAADLYTGVAPSAAPSAAAIATFLDVPPTARL